MDNVWKALLGLVMIFALLLFGVEMVNTMPGYLDQGIVMFLLFVLMAVIIVWMIK